MRRDLTLALLLVSVLLPSAAACGGGNASAGGGTTPPPPSADDRLFEPTTAPETLAVTSDAFLDGATIPDVHVYSGFGCNGGNVSPPLAWTNVPEGTQSFAVVVHDPDAPTGVGFFHWVLLDVPATTTALPAGFSTSNPSGVVQAHTDFGATGYGGPCPPAGDAPHRYFVTVYALDVPTVGLGATATGALARFSLAQHTLAFGRLHGTYGR